MRIPRPALLKTFPIVHRVAVSKDSGARDREVSGDVGESRGRRDGRDGKCRGAVSVDFAVSVAVLLMLMLLMLLLLLLMLLLSLPLALLLMLLLVLLLVLMSAVLDGSAAATPDSALMRIPAV